MTPLPAIFVSHGAPTLVFDDVPARSFLRTVGRQLTKPSAVVVVSAHYETDGVHVNDADRPRMIHDFRGFPPELYELDYPAAGAPQLANQVVDLVRSAGLDAKTDGSWGLDHGTWVPLSLMYPDADVPVVAVSVDPQAGPDHHWRLGAALAPLREDGVLIIGSGSFTHNLAEFRGRGSIDAPAPDWVDSFVDWTSRAIEEGRVDALLDYRRQAPEAERNHPTEEHLLPLFAAMGAGGGVGRRMHASTTFSILAMDAYAFG